MPPADSIMVIGVGGFGGRMIKRMLRERVQGVELFAVDTDAAALAAVGTENTLLIGACRTKGLGAGGNPSTGRWAALDHSGQLAKRLSGVDLVLVVAGAGGGTGSGAAPVVAELASAQGSLTLAVTTTPLAIEGRRIAVAQRYLPILQRAADSLIAIGLQKIAGSDSEAASMLPLFSEAEGIVLDAIRGISDTLTRLGVISVCLEDIRAVLCHGQCHMGIGCASGANRVPKALEAALCSPLLDGIDPFGARSVLVNVTASPDLATNEINEAMALIEDRLPDHSLAVIAVVMDGAINEAVRVTVYASGPGAV